MNINENFSLLPFNTFGMDVKCRYFIEYSNTDELNKILTGNLLANDNFLHIGRGSNLLFLSDYKGIILHSGIHFISVTEETNDHVLVDVGSGVIWDDVVDHCVKQGWYGAENLSLIPGETGAAAVQNIGAYGAEIQDIIESVSTMDMAGNIRIFTKKECGYGYRESIFKKELKGKLIVTSVRLKLSKKPAFNLRYQQLEADVKKTGELSLENIRKTIVATRQYKLPDPAINGNAGSFFMNPVVSVDIFNAIRQMHPTVPHYQVSDEWVKIPAAWLIDQCGWKGKSLGRAGVHDKQPLVLINKGGATGEEIVALAKKIQQDVKSTFNIDLHPEVNYI